MKLNLGCGSDIREDWINVDIRFGPGVDLVADVRSLPYPDGYASEILALDLCEHFPATETAGVLAEWHRLLTDRGTLTLRVPNLQALCVQIAYWHDKPGIQLEALVTNLYGGHAYGERGEFDTHHWGFTPASLHVALSAAGFEIKDNDHATNMTVTAVRI